MKLHMDFFSLLIIMYFILLAVFAILALLVIILVTTKKSSKSSIRYGSQFVTIDKNGARLGPSGSVVFTEAGSIKKGGLEVKFYMISDVTKTYYMMYQPQNQKVVAQAQISTNVDAGIPSEALWFVATVNGKSSISVMDGSIANMKHLGISGTTLTASETPFESWILQV